MQNHQGQLRSSLVQALRTRPHTALVMVGLLVMTFVIYSPALRNGFVNWDDDVYVLENSRIHSLNPGDILDLFARPYYSNYIPVTLLSHAIDYAFWKTNSWGHHLTSILLHCLNTVWVFLLTLIIVVLAEESVPSHIEKPAHWFRERLRTSTLLGGTITALLFAFHPLRVESVAWVSGRKDLLCAAFLLPSTIAYIIYSLQRREHGGERWYGLSFLLFILAVLSKPVAVVAPILLAALDLLLVDRKGWRNRWRQVLTMLLPFLAVSIVVGVVTMMLGESGKPSFAVKGLEGTERWLLPLYSLSFPLGKLVWPLRLSPVYSGPGLTAMILGAIVVVAITAFVVIMVWRKRPVWFLAFFAYLIFIGPTLGGIGAGIQPWADRYAYLATVGLLMLCGGVVKRVWEHAEASGRRFALCIVTTTIVLAVVVLLVGETIAQLKIWKDSESLWAYAVVNAPAHPLPYNSLGAVYYDRREYDRALVMYQRAIDIDPTYHRAYANLGMVYGARGDTAKAVQSFMTARRLRPDYVEAYTGLGSLYLKQGRLRDAIAQYDEALSVDPGAAKAMYNKGLAYYQLGDRDSALIMFEKTTQLQPRYANAYVNAAVIYTDNGDTQAAIDMFTKAARLGSMEARRLLLSKGIGW